MKKPEEIKKGLEYCPGNDCAGCLYYDDCVHGDDDYALEHDALAYIQQLEAQVPKWISVEERMPEDEEFVLCWYKDEFGDEWSTVGMKIQWGCGWDLDIDDNSGRNLTVTHWMPLPEPPEGDEDEEP